MLALSSRLFLFYVRWDSRGFLFSIRILIRTLQDCKILCVGLMVLSIYRTSLTCRNTMRNSQARHVQSQEAPQGVHLRRKILVRDWKQNCRLLNRRGGFSQGFLVIMYFLYAHVQLVLLLLPTASVFLLFHSVKPLGLKI